MIRKLKEIHDKICDPDANNLQKVADQSLECLAGAIEIYDREQARAQERRQRKQSDMAMLAQLSQL